LIDRCHYDYLEVLMLSESVRLGFWVKPISDKFNGAAGTMDMICIAGYELSSHLLDSVV
jgi:hypothetical protein